MPLGNYSGGRDAVHIWHPDIHENDSWAQQSGEFHGRISILGLTDDLEILLGTEHLRQPFPDHLMIVGKQDSDFESGSGLEGSMNLHIGGISGGAVSRFAIGTVIVMRAPIPGDESISTLPHTSPIRSLIENRPNPAPLSRPLKSDDIESDPCVGNDHLQSLTIFFEMHLCRKSSSSA